MVGQTISHYEVLEKVGEGGMGVVYAARDKRLDRLVALKFLAPHLASDERDKQRFIQEAKAASALDHPNICNVHEIDETPDGRMFIAMTLYDGVSLDEKIRQAPLKIEEALDIGVQIATGLQAAHEKGIIHRDIKPSNIIVTGKDRCIIMDFGLARAVGEARLTMSGATLGTVPYMSPEQARGDTIDHRTDIWSLGVVLYEMIAGQLPFKSSYDQAVVYAILNEQPEPATSLRSDVPIEFERIVKKTMEKDLGLRYQSAGDLVADLKGLARHLESGIRTELTFRKRSPQRGRAYVYAAALMVAMLTGITSWFLLSGRSEAINSVAVLPLDNLTGDPSQEYFVDGMHEALISELSKISALKVISRTSAMQYKGSKKPPIPQIARELGVNGVVEGSVIREGNRVRITVQLIHGPTDEHRWAESYEREMQSILALHSEVAQAIARQIRVEITPQEEIRLAAARPVNPKAYEAYLLGRHYWNNRSIRGFELAVQTFREVIELDPEYVPAYAGLADTYMLMGEQGAIPQRDARTLAGAAINTALKLDENFTGGQSTLGHWKLHFEMDWVGAEGALKLAIEQNPSDALAHARYGRFLTFFGRFDEAIERLHRARELDPLSPLVGAYVGQVYLLARRYDEASQYLERSAQLSPDHALIRHNLGELHLAAGRFDQAIGELERSVELSARDSGVASSHYLAMLGCAYAKASRPKEATEVLNELSRRDSTGLVSTFDMASLLTALGDEDTALTWLERGYADGDVWFTELSVWPWLDPLRGEPRFQAILRNLHLPVLAGTNR